MTDAAFAQQVERDALGVGMAPDVAAALAAIVSKPQHRPGPREPRTFVGHALAPALTIEHAVHLFGLPAALAADFKAAGVATAQAAAPLLRTYLAQSVRRSPAAAASALGLHLLNRRLIGKKAPRA